MFGRLFCEILFNFSDEDRRRCAESTAVDESTWKLIQRCCAENPKDRPTIDEVVEEMYSPFPLLSRYRRN